MTLKEFISLVLSDVWGDNPELAEKLYKYINTEFWAMVFKRRDEVKHSVPKEYQNNPEMYAFALLCIEEGLTENDVQVLINILPDKQLKDRLRRSFDEAYVEYGFLSIEDGGRGEEF